MAMKVSTRNKAEHEIVLLSIKDIKDDSFTLLLENLNSNAEMLVLKGILSCQCP